MKRISFYLFVLCMATLSSVLQAQQPASFSWPSGKEAAISLTFDDARASQVEKGTALLDEYGVKATFYVLPGPVKEQLAGWKKAVASGHEIGNHSLNHPCSGNFPWARQKALEDFSMEDIRKELTESNKQIESMLNVKPQVFAYPCGQKFVGRGLNTKSYVPVVAELFVSGRGWRDEGPNDPTFCDMAQITGMELDGKTFESILPLIESARKNHQWIVFAGHEMNDSGEQTTRLETLRRLMEYVQNPGNGVWLAPVGSVVKYIKERKP
ncbi:MAG TPA: polysaccharide deacetylase family protein [Chryseolinea sp.]